MTSCMIILLILASLLSVRADTGCEKISDKYDIISEATIDKLQLDNYSTEIGTTVHVTCLNKDFVLFGARKLTCLQSGWDADIPTCGVKRILPKSYNLIIGLSVGGSCLLITIIIVAFVVRRRTRNKEPTRHLDQRLNKSKQKKIYSEEMKTKYMDQETSLDKQPNVYKVWSHDRTIKKFITAFNHSDLTQKGGKMFGVKDVLIVLEDDGTEIEDDSALEACKDKTLQIISKKQSWYRNSLPDNVVIDLRDGQETGSDFGTVRSYHM